MLGCAVTAMHCKEAVYKQKIAALQFRLDVRKSLLRCIWKKKCSSIDSPNRLRAKLKMKDLKIRKGIRQKSEEMLLSKRSNRHCGIFTKSLCGVLWDFLLFTCVT